MIKSKLLTLLLAGTVTLTAVAMASVAAMDRGGTVIDKALLMAMSVVIVLAVHLLLAMTRRPAAWLVWTGCLLCAIYGHLTFLTHASLRAGDIRARQSALAVGTEHQVETTREAMAGIKARPIAIVAAELAQSSVRRERAALREEIAEGRRTEALQDQLVHLSGISTTAQVSGATDPVTARLAAVTGYSESGVSVVIGMTFSILLELVGALLWYEALSKSEVYTERTTETVTAAATHPVTDTVTTLRSAIEAGSCRETVASIREFLGCSQARAMELRRALSI